MLRLLPILVLMFQASAFGEQLTLNLNEPKQPPRQLELRLEEPSEKDIAAPVLIKQGEDTQIGLFTVEPTPQRPDALMIIREELQKIAMIEQAKAQKDGVFWSTTKRFTPESLTFFIAIGGVTFNSMWIKSHGDPLAMERHILSIKDPIAHLSFYAFMQTQGFYMDFFTKRGGMHAMDEVTRARMMRRLTYQGMALGSLASSIIADLGQSGKMCVDKWVKGKTDALSIEMCNQAWKNWTVRNKFTQYFPQIISLWAAQATTELLEAGAHRVFSKVTTAQFAKNILSSKFLLKQAYKITGADVVLTLSGGGWGIKGIKLLGKLTRFSFFVGVDHILSNYTYRPINNLIKPLFFDFDALAINELWYQADEGKWDSNKIQNKRNAEKFAKEIENYTTQMQQWRDHLNQDAEQDLAGWQEMTKKILNQIDYSYKYYKGFVDGLFQLMNRNYLIEKKELAPSAANVIAGYPLRTLPFYGVSTGVYQPISGRVEDLYINSPNELELRQKEHVLKVAAKFKEALPSFEGKDLTKLSSIVDKLLSNDSLKMSSGLHDMNQIIDLDDLERSNPNNEFQHTTNSARLVDALSVLKRALGNPLPVVYPFAGYSQAFAAHSSNFSVADAADFGKWSISKKYKFNKEADLMFYNMLCGDETGKLYKIQLKGVNFLTPQFTGPTILRKDSHRAEFCNSYKGTENLYSTKINNADLKTFFLENVNYDAIGDYRDKNNAKTFESWWIKQTKEPLSAEFKNFDNEFKKVFATAYANFFDQRSFYKFFVDGLNQSKYLPKSLKASLQAESNMYLQILNRTLLPDSAPIPYKKTFADGVLDAILLTKDSGVMSPISRLTGTLYSGVMTKYNYVEFAKLNSEKNAFESIYKQTHPEVQKLYNLLENYYSFISTQNVNFDEYIRYSKQIDTSINDILVALELKKISTEKSQEQSEDLGSVTPSSTGSESSDKIYEDVAVQNPTYKQFIAVSAIKGLKQVESEIRKFIRMKIVLSKSLELDQKEFMADWNNANRNNNPNQQRKTTYGGK